MQKKSFSILAENKAIFIREDSQIDLLPETFSTFLSDFHLLPAFQPKIDNEFKMCSLDDADDA